MAPSISSITSPGCSPAFCGRRTRERRDDREAAVVRERGAGGGGPDPVDRADGRADALELARDPLERGPELVRGQVLRVRVVERADHPLDRALDERLAVDRAPRVPVGDRASTYPRTAGRRPRRPTACRASARTAGRARSRRRTSRCRPARRPARRRRRRCLRGSLRRPTSAPGRRPPPARPRSAGFGRGVVRARIHRGFERRGRVTRCGRRKGRDRDLRRRLLRRQRGVQTHWDSG